MSTITKEPHAKYWLGHWTDHLNIDDPLWPFALKRVHGGVTQLINGITSRPVAVKWEHNKVPSAARAVDWGGVDQINLQPLTEPKGLDMLVGMSLHEASHLILSDQFYRIVSSDEVKKFIAVVFRDFTMPTHEPFKMVLNIIEDFRVDQIQFEKYPGYRQYYRALYEHYYNNEDVIVRLSKPATTINEYLMHLCYCRHPKFDVSLTPGMEEMVKTLNPPYVQRFTNIREDDISRFVSRPTLVSMPSVVECAVKICKIMFENVKNNDSSPQNQPDMTGGMGDITAEDLENALIEIDNEIMDDAATKILLENKLGHVLNLPTDFGPDNLKIDDLNELATSDIDAHVKQLSSTVPKSRVSCMVFGPKSILSGTGRFYTAYARPQIVNDGIQLGKLLAKRLKIMGETRPLEYNRKPAGTLDRRRVHAIGADDYNIFKKTFEERIHPVTLVVSVDGSGSMKAGWNSVLKLMATLASAAKHSPHLEVKISIRDSEYNVVNIAKVFDSQVNTLADIQKIIPHLYPDGGTPEGLAFEFMDDVYPLDYSRRNFFLNISDGLPGGHEALTYTGMNAVQHTEKIINKMRKSREILSYFIGGSDGGSHANFVKMYGKDAKFINTANLMEIAQTLNNLFVEKS